MRSCICLQKAGVAAGASLSTEEMYNDPHVNARGALIEQDHPQGGHNLVWRTAWKSDSTKKNPPAPLLGEHNEYVFKDLLGMSDSEIAGLTDKKVID